MNTQASSASTAVAAGQVGLLPPQSAMWAPLSWSIAFPLAMANTLVSDVGWAKGISFSGRPPRSLACNSLRCVSLITSRSTRTSATPGSLLTAAVTSLVMVSRSGQPDTVR